MDRVLPPATPFHRWRPAICLTLCLCLWPGAPWAAEIYKSVDAEGHVTYSDRPEMSNSTVDLRATDDDSDEIGDLSAATPPPPLPDSEQPDCPQDGDLWTPGYWTYNGAGYAWVPGDWVIPPSVEVVWTPGYWVFVRNAFRFRRGYWGPHVGYYGGINYGFGYPGFGYLGGRWQGKVFLYNSAVNHLKASMLSHAYDEPELNPRTASRVSYNGGPGGTSTVPTAQERMAAQSRLHPVPQRIHLQPNPAVVPNMAPSDHEPSAAATPVVSRQPLPRRNTANIETQPPPAVNARTRPVPAAKPVRARPTPVIKSITLK